MVAKELPPMGSSAAAHQLRSRPVQCGALLLAGQGIYDLPVEKRVGGSRALSAFENGRGLAPQVPRNHRVAWCHSGRAGPHHPSVGAIRLSEPPAPTAV